MTESDILYQNGPFWICRALFSTGRFKPKSEGYQVFEAGITHSKLRATIGYSGQPGFIRAKEYADKLAAERTTP